MFEDWWGRWNTPVEVVATQNYYAHLATQFGRNIPVEVGPSQNYVSKEDMFPRQAGIIPIKLLSAELNKYNLGRTHSSSGMFPVKLLCHRDKVCKLRHPARVGGIEPWSSFPNRITFFKRKRFPNWKGMWPWKWLLLRLSVLRKVRLSRRGEIVPCNIMLESLRETNLCLCCMHMTPVHSQNEMFGLVCNDRDGIYVIVDMNPIRVDWSKVLLR